MPEEGKTDSESSCSFFGKRKAITRKNALCLRRKRTRKAVVSSSKKKSGYPKEWITFAENTPWTPSTGYPVSYVFWDSSLSRASGRIRMTKNRFFTGKGNSRIRTTRLILADKWQRFRQPDSHWNSALANPCKQVSSPILYHKLLKKSVTFLVAFGCVL